MKYRNKNQRLHMIALLGVGLLTFNSYGQTTAALQNDNDEEYEVGRNINDEVGDKKEIKKTEAFYGSASFSVSSGLGNTAGISGTSFKPALVLQKKVNRATSDNLSLGFTTDIDLGFEKIFAVDERPAEIHTVVNIDAEKAALDRLYCKIGVFEESSLYLGLARSNFCSISAAPKTHKALQVGWEIPFDSFGLGFSIEQAKEIKFYAEKTADTTRVVQPTKFLPAASLGFKYPLPDEIGKIELSGLVRAIEYSPSKRVTKLGAGLGGNLAASFDITKDTTTVVINGIYGSGIGDYMPIISALADEEHTVYVTPKNVVKNIDAFGVYGKANHKFVPSFLGTLNVGLTKIISDERHKKNKDTYNVGVYAGVSFTYIVTKMIELGMGYTAGIVGDFDKTMKNGNQLLFFSSFSFRKEIEDKDMQI